MSTDLPHDPYITAVESALHGATLFPTDCWTSEVDEFEDDGITTTLSAVLSWNGSHPAVADELPHGLLLCWALTTGWQWAERRADGSNEIPQDLPVELWAAPTAIVAAVRELLTGKTTPPGSVEEWGQAAQARAGADAWRAE